jgi:hypothetical protein
MSARRRDARRTRNEPETTRSERRNLIERAFTRHHIFQSRARGDAAQGIGVGKSKIRIEKCSALSALGARRRRGSRRCSTLPTPPLPLEIAIARASRTVRVRSAALRGPTLICCPNG